MDRVFQRLSLVGIITPASKGTGDHDATAFELKNDEVALFVLSTGTLGSSATVDASAYCSDASGGTYAQVSGSAITQIVKASGDDKQILLELRAKDLPASKPWVKFRVAVGTASSVASAVVLKFKEGYAPANDANLASVVQTKYL